MHIHHTHHSSQSWNNPNTQGKLEKAFEEAENLKGFMGTVLVVQNGQVVFNKACGVSRGNIPNGLDTTYRWESVTKVITATAVMKLAEMRLININAYITDYLPEYKGSPGLSGITIKELLNYTSGIPDFPKEYPPQWKDHPPTALKDIIDLIASEPRGANGGPPNSANKAYQYSDTAYNLLGFLIDRVTQQLSPQMNSYSKFIQKEIFDPAGMTTAHAPDTAAEDNPDAEGHDINGNPVDPDNLLFRLGTGNIYGSAMDLYHFNQALTDGKILSTADISTMQQEMYGWFGNTNVVPGVKDYEKGGSMDGGEAFYIRIPGTDTTIVVLSDIDPKDHSDPSTRVEYLAESIEKILLSQQIEP
jgi:CubicO group peptidase (beta-lactamase class C family)